MTEIVFEAQSQSLCKACGLCCSGHLFAWTLLDAKELDGMEKLGAKVIRNDPHQRGFLQPCSLWKGVCTIYTAPQYPRSCKRYKCNVLRRLLDEELSFDDALKIIEDILSLIREIEPLLPNLREISFRERLIAHKEELEAKKENLDGDFMRKTAALLLRYEEDFGVDDFIDYD